MLHKKTPDQDGWYWIELDEEWHMAHFDAESDEQSLAACVISHSGVMRLQEVKPEWVARWIGPLGCPGGDFGDNIVEFSIAMHEKAEAAGQALMLRHMEDNGAAMTEFGIADHKMFATGKLVDEHGTPRNIIRVRQDEPEVEYAKP